ncbi:endonuclease/exonuclease/phosphatase family protein [Paracrocinitomix mangrovi]|uniref:endonuclease/exonuclease/phosphatase family protein n=1 Tax=Paracrocinitomix mangrovi TaxID=2862509 RepID=UPI001C8E9D3F|nr:endonuclease/exonuclease/phosphatase family protein [Paracrocinitomix mangrovi]UKN02097.1 endonuclease/exonuclease/phosphatase family protein [Paracrocinitomix mangrovi]
MRKLNFLIVLIAANLLISNAATAQNQKKSYQIACVGFYNLENLFDYWDDTLIRDEEYLPDGAKGWDSTRYVTKLEHMSRVISEIGTKYTPDGAAVLGVCEVENKGVLEDLVNMPSIKDRNYKIVHYDSPDARGVDVGLLYQEKYFKVKNSTKYPLNFQDDDGKVRHTRDQLVVTGEMQGEDVSIIVCHWPSRWGGQKASEPRRVEAAKVSRRIIDSLQTLNADSKIILMGDLNDDPVNVSMTEYVRAKGKKGKLKKGDLYNTMWDHYKKGNGTLAYRDAWNLFDQIVITQPFLKEDATKYILHVAEVYSQPYMIQQEGQYAGYPLRTHAGGKWTNGYSDHFPSYIILKKYAN